MITQPKTGELGFAPGLRLRNTRWGDVEAVAKLILDVCTADGDPILAPSAANLANEWRTEGFTLERDAWVVEAEDGRILGYEELNIRHAHAAMWGDGYVHPDFLGRGIGTALLRSMDARALEEMKLADPDLRVYIRNGLSAGDKAGCALHEAEGYKPVRFSWRMEIELKEAPAAPQWPEGISLRPFSVEEHNRAVFYAHEEAFSDHWGHTPGTFTQWQQRMVGREDFDPALWYIAWDGDQVAGYSLCYYRGETGWVGTLGVRRPWRKRGLGMALLMHSFGEFYKRGTRTIGLGVDASNPTGATRLYEKAGMHVASEYAIYEKEYRAGREYEQETEGN